MKITEIYADSGQRHIDELRVRGDFDGSELITQFWPIRDLQHLYVGISYFIDMLVVDNEYLFNVRLILVTEETRMDSDFSTYTFKIYGNWCAYYPPPHVPDPEFLS